MDERKGILTPEQEEILDKLIKSKNTLVEAADGPLISLIDNQGIERLKAQIIEKNPEVLPIVYQIIDILFVGLEALTEGE